MLAVTHQGAVKWASRKMPPTSRTERSTSDSESVLMASPPVWTNGQVFRWSDHSRSTGPRLSTFSRQPVQLFSTVVMPHAPLRKLEKNVEDDMAINVKQM